MADELLITDLTCALPRDGWTDDDSTVHKPVAARPPGGWRIIDYQSDHYAGRALQTSDPDSWTLRIPLNARGWHAISLGISERQGLQAAIEVRLTGQEYWQMLRTQDGDSGLPTPLHEEPWLIADLAGQDLEVRFPRNLQNLPHSFRPPQIGTMANLYSVRLTPIRDEHLPVVQSSRHCRLVYINDGFGIFYAARTPGPHIVSDALAPWSGGDWDVCCFGNIGGDLVNFPSEVGTPCGADGWDFIREGDRRVRDNLQAALAAGDDPLRQAIELAHAQGQQCWMYLRPQAYTADPPFDHALRSRFFSEHPEWRCVEANGTPFSKLSIAYAGVRRHLNAILGEALERGADGLTLAFVRGYPVVRYEQPVLKRYRDRHGVDAVVLPDTDPSLRALWAEYVTEWLHEIRALLDEAGPSPLASRRELSVIVGPDLEWNLRFGFDIAAWAQQGLVDVVMPYPYRKPADVEINVAEFATLLAGTRTRLLPSFGSYHQKTTIARVRQKAHEFYQAGAHGLSRWDAYGYLSRLQLDDPDLQALWCEHYMPPQVIELTELGGLSLECWGPMLGF